MVHFSLIKGKSGSTKWNNTVRIRYIVQKMKSWNPFRLRRHKTLCTFNEELLFTVFVVNIGTVLTASHPKMCPSVYNHDTITPCLSRHRLATHWVPCRFRSAPDKPTGAVTRRQHFSPSAIMGLLSFSYLLSAARPISSRHRVSRNEINPGCSGGGTPGWLTKHAEIKWNRCLLVFVFCPPGREGCLAMEKRRLRIVNWIIRYEF